MHFRIHRDGTDNVVRAAEEHGVRKLVQMSALGADPDGNTAYIKSKGLAESIVKDSSLEWTIFRPSVIFGDGGEFVAYTKQLATPYLTPLPGGGKTRFQPIWVGDLVPMLADAVEGKHPETEAEEGAEMEAEAASEAEAEAETDEGEAEAEDGDAEDEAETAADEPEAESAPETETDPHVGQIYEIGGPEVLTLAEVARLAHAADGKPVDVVPIPMALAGIGLKSLDYVPESMLDSLPGVPRMGSDQYRSLQFDNTTDDNDVAAFGVSEADLTTLASYLGVEADADEA
jgi:NADH dehydrogenase